MQSTRTFGVELELHLNGKTRGELAVAMRRKGLKVFCEDYNHNTRDHWKVTTDASLDPHGRLGTSAEIVSPVLQGDDGLAQARKAAEAAKSIGATVSTRCGLHVHVFAGDLSVDQLRNLAINFVHCETAFDAIVPPSRRRDCNRYILSNRTAFGGSYDNEAINRAIDAYKAATTRETLITAVADAGRPHNEYGNRYRKLNFRPLESYNTVEFRQHSGTVEAEKVSNWIELVTAFVDRCAKSQPRKRPSTKPHVPATECAMMLRFLKVRPEVKAYYRARMKTLSAATMTAAE
jgi:hypothetical protein